MEEILQGSGTLKSLTYGEKYDVDYEIHFVTSIKPGTATTAPITRTRGFVESIQTCDGSSLPDGDYELRDRNLFVKIRLQNDAWSVLEAHW